jgi:hypothetical protein
MKRSALFLLVLASVGCGNNDQSTNKRLEAPAIEIVQDGATGEVRIPVEELPANFDSQSPAEQQQTVEQLIVGSGAEGSDGFSLTCAARKACAYYWVNGRAYLYCWGGWGCTR